MRPDIRHEQFMLLFHEFERANPGPVMRKLSELTGISQNYLSQVKHRQKSIGNKTARRIEQAFGLEEGALDISQEARFKMLLHKWYEYEHGEMIKRMLAQRGA